MTVVVTASRGAPGALVTASVLGATHAAFSFYWASGGTLLVWSLGTDLVDSFSGREWLLAPIGAVKLIAALAPLVLARAVGGYVHVNETRLRIEIGRTSGRGGLVMRIRNRCTFTDFPGWVVTDPSG